jgi:hypothetical protein
MDRSEKIWEIRRACIKANLDLWNDHGNVLKRRMTAGVAVPTKLGLADVLLAWKTVNYQKMEDDEDEDTMNAAQELTAQIVFRWDVRRDDINEQADGMIDLLADLIL